MSEMAARLRRYEYDVALSFAGEDRGPVEGVAELLDEAGFRLFYDKWEQHRLLGVDLYEYLSGLYQNRARFCVMFISRHYASKVWPNLERKAAQAWALHENKEYILPVVMDDVSVRGVLPTIGHLKWEKHDWNDPGRVANIIIAKLRDAGLSSSEPSDTEDKDIWWFGQRVIEKSFRVRRRLHKVRYQRDDGWTRKIVHLWLDDDERVHEEYPVFTWKRVERTFEVDGIRCKFSYWSLGWVAGGAFVAGEEQVF